MSEISWIDLIQTSAIIIALLFTATEIRSRTKEQRFRNYVDFINRFVELSLLMVEKTELHSLYNANPSDINRNYDQLSPEEKSRVFFCDAIIALFETVWIASKEKRLEKDEWKYWIRWAKDLKKSPEFRYTLEKVAGEYDDEFLDELR